MVEQSLKRNTGMKILVFFLSFMFLCSLSVAKVDLKSTQRLIIPVDNVTPRFSRNDVEQIIPLDLKSGERENIVLSRIADRGFSYWYQNSGLKDSSVGRMAHEAQQKLKTDVVVKDAGASGVDHRFSFKFEIFQALAKVEYTGWLNAAINYDVRETATNIFFKEKLFDGKDLFLNHKSTRQQDLSMIGFVWSW